MSDISTSTAPSTDPRIALITGASRGLGRASALAVARAGIDVIITYRSRAEEAGAVVAEIEGLGRTAVALPLDVAEAASFGVFAESVRAALRERWGRDRLDFLVNNAGTAGITPLGGTDEATLDRLFLEHVKGVYLLTQTLEPLLADAGRIVNTSSGLARFVSPGGYSVYAAMKGAVEVLTRYWAAELGPRGITVNTIAPGPIATDFAGGHVRDTPALQEHLASQTALGRVGMPDDVGGAVAALLAGDTGWVTAQRIEVSGGSRI